MYKQKGDKEVMNKKYGIASLILFVVLTTVLISGCIGGSETDPATNSESGNAELKNQAKVDEILSNYDQDGNGLIDRGEFDQWGASVGLDASDDASMEALFSKYDKNGDGNLDKNELDALVEDHK